jgi:broad specificity phosphatase PhoE
MDEAILARHAESEYSVRGAINGDVAVPVALTELGREQARRLGEEIRDDPIDLCVTSEFGRVLETAEIALDGRGVPRLVLPDLNDIRVGRWEGRPLADYRVWARSHGPDDVTEGGGESRAATVRRYVRAFRAILARPERIVLVVTHGLPIRYLLNAAEGRDPVPAIDQVEYATPYRLSREQVELGVERLDRWCAAPAW